jgi:hypothetical protein
MLMIVCPEPPLPDEAAQNIVKSSVPQRVADLPDEIEDMDIDQPSQPLFERRKPRSKPLEDEDPDEIEDDSDEGTEGEEEGDDADKGDKVCDMCYEKVIFANNICQSKRDIFRAAVNRFSSQTSTEDIPSPPARRSKKIVSSARYVPSINVKV